jgi:Mce-associated membrane protein
LTGLALLVAVALAAAAALVAVTAVKLGGLTSPAAASAGDLTPATAPGRELLGAARQAAVTYTTYDYRHLDQNFGDFAALTTGTLRKAYLNDAAALKAQFTKLKVQATGSVVSAGIGQVTPAAAGRPLTATVLVALDDVVRNLAAGHHSQTRYDRLVMTMQRVGGRWLCSGVNAA